MPDRVAILCSGPSVDARLLAAIPCHTIGINMSYVAHKSTYHVFTAAPLIYGHRNYLNKLTPWAERRFCPVVSTECETPPQITSWNVKSIQSAVEFPKLPVPYDIMRDGWIACGGAPMALQVAVGLGYQEIIYLGLDLRIDGRIHFYADHHAAHLSGLNTPSQRRLGFAVQADCLANLKPWLEEVGVCVVNTGASEVFERVEFGEVFGCQPS